jgi:hypothetical protein
MGRFNSMLAKKLGIHMKHIYLLILAALFCSSQALEVKISSGKTEINVSITASPNDVNAVGDKLKMVAGELRISRQNRLKEVECGIIEARVKAQKYGRDSEWLMQSVSEIAVDINGINNGKATVPETYKMFSDKITIVIENLTALKKFSELQEAALIKEKQAIEDEMTVLGVMMQ